MKSPFLVFLLSLLAFFFLHPWTGMGLVLRLGLGITALAMVFSALRCVSLKRGWYVMALASGLAGAIASIASALRDEFVLHVASDFLLAVFIVVVAVMVTIRVLRSAHVSMDTVMGAACVYLLMGFFWAKMFTLLESLQPGSFRLPPLSPEEMLNAYGQVTVAAHLTYHSFITLTTVGYGDVIPLTPPARTMAMLEGLGGQLYVAIMIARIVALQVSHAAKSPGD